jgi:hypothetical protein
LLASPVLGRAERAEPVAATAPSGDWWAATQANIRADLGLDAAGSLGPIADWTETGQYNGDLFGTSVASAGDVNGDGYADLIVGAYGYASGAEQGKVYLFYGWATGLSPSAGWTTTGESAGDGFGRSVAGAGDVNGDGYSDVIIGAHTRSGGGKAYLFLGAQSGLATAPAWTATGSADGDLFGQSVASAGDVNGDGFADVIVGAEGYSTSAGTAYVYHGGASGPSSTHDWIGIGPTSNVRFGASVAGAGDVNGDGYGDIIVGAPGLLTNTGAAYVWHGSSSGLAIGDDWVEAGAAAGDLFGASVAAAGDVNGDGYGDIIVGAPGADAGGVYAYYGAETGLGDSADWSAGGSGGLQHFGTSVAGAGDVNGDGYADILIGAPGYPIVDNSKGAAFLYIGSDAGLLTGHSWMKEGPTDNSELGVSVAGAGDVNGDGYADVAVAAPGYASGLNQGRAYVYYGSGSPPNDTHDWKETGENNYDYFGTVVASAGDVDGDGYADVLVGAPAYVGTGNRGKAYLFHGSADGIATFPAWTDLGDFEGVKFGYALAGAGDINGDGFGDVIVGAPTFTLSNSTGKVYLFYGSASGLSASPDWSATGQAVGDFFGGAVASAGDVNGDGYADLVVGASEASSGAGAAYIYHGGPTGPASTADWTFTEESAGAWFGAALAGAGDINGDGYGDLIVGAPRFDNGALLTAGKTYLFTGSASGLGGSAAWTMTSLSAEKYWGNSVAAAGDVNGDGYGDVVIGAPGLTSGDTGFAQIFHGGPGGLPSTPSWTGMGENTEDRFGASVAGVGDVNGDGYADVMVGAYGYDDDTNNGAGKAYLYLGSAIGLPLWPDWGVTGEAQGDGLGAWVAGAGDVNGDGFSDVLGGAKYYGGSNQGAAYAFLGNGTEGRQVLAQQIHTGGGGQLVPPWGLSGDTHSFHTSMFATHPAGRGAVKLQVEACPPGAPFGDNACTLVETASWQILGAVPEGELMQETLSGLDALTLYRWRARVLYAPLFVLRTAITPPPNPAHGPWRHFLGKAFEADIRTSPCNRAVDVAPDSDSRGGVAGTTVGFELQVKNTGNCADTFDVSWFANQWPTHAPATVGPLDAGQSTSVEVTVDIPGDALVGNFDNVAVRFTSQGDPSVYDSSALGTHVISGFFIYLPIAVRD